MHSGQCLLKVQALEMNHTLSLAFKTFSKLFNDSNRGFAVSFKICRNHICPSQEPSTLPPQLLPVRLTTYRTHSPKLRLLLVLT